MIKSFKHKGLEKFWTTGSKKGIQAHHAAKLQLILEALDEAETAEDMNFPGWRLHVLTGIWKGRYSVTVNKNWRVTFRFNKGNAEIIDYEDYH